MRLNATPSARGCDGNNVLADDADDRRADAVQGHGDARTVDMNGSETESDVRGQIAIGGHCRAQSAS